MTAIVTVTGAGIKQSIAGKQGWRIGLRQGAARDGTGNNAASPSAGASNDPLLRLLGYDYPGDGSGDSMDYPGRPE